MTTREHINVLIIGGGYAGVACALRLGRGMQRRGRGSVRLINTGFDFVERIRLHQMAAGTALPLRPLAPLLARAGVAFIRGHVMRIDLQRREVLLRDQRVKWDRLVIATGSVIAPPLLDGVAEHTIALNGGMAEDIAARLTVLPREARVTVAGGGLTGIETAAEIAAAHPRLNVTLLSRGALAEGWSAAARDYLPRALQRLGVALQTGVEVQGARPHRLLTSAGPLHHDLCIWAGGFSFPSPGAPAGLAVNTAGQVRVDPQWRALSHPEVYIAGDLASPVIAPGDPLLPGCKSAQPAGVHVAMNLLHEIDGKPPRSFDMATPFHCVSLGRRDGLIQFPDRWGNLAGPVLTGRSGALFKELVSRATWWSLALESRGIPAVQWMRTGYAPEQLEPGRSAKGIEAVRPWHPPGV